MMGLHMFDIGFIARHTDKQTNKLLSVHVEILESVKHIFLGPLRFEVHMVIRAMVIFDSLGS